MDCSDAQLQSGRRRAQWGKAVRQRAVERQAARDPPGWGLRPAKAKKAGVWSVYLPGTEDANAASQTADVAWPTGLTIGSLPTLKFPPLELEKIPVHSGSS